ncbi:MAG: transposase [Thiohalocapsa sp.]
MGKRDREPQGHLWVETADLARAPGHPFYRRLNELLERERFDEFVEQQCQRFYAEGIGRPSMPPAVYFRLLLVGYFEGLNAERAIAWRLADSLSLRQFCGYELNAQTPDHSTLSRTRRLLDEEVHGAVFSWVLGVLAKEGLIRGKTLGVDATTLEANAAMRSIVRRDSGEDYAGYLRSLAEASGESTADRQELARRDRKRKKKTSNRDWKNPHDPDAKITRMKDGRTGLAHKAEHAVDLDTGAVVAVTVQPADRGDCTSQEETLEEAAGRLVDAVDGEAAEAAPEDDALLREVVADRGYHSSAVLASHRAMGIRSYIAEPKRPRRRWKGKNREAEQKALYANRRRLQGSRARRLSRLRAERVERSFAHCYETGGLRRNYTRGHDNLRKRLLVHVAGFNLGLLMRQLFGFGKPRCLQGAMGRFVALVIGRLRSIWPLRSSLAAWRPVWIRLALQSRMAGEMLVTIP